MTEADQSEIIKAAVTMQYQGIWIRFISFLIDTIVLGVLIGVIGSILGFSVVSRTAGWGFGLLSFIIFLAYFTYLEGSKGQTIGKMVTKIKVVGEDGEMINMNQAFTRTPRNRWPISLSNRCYPNLEVGKETASGRSYCQDGSYKGMISDFSLYFRISGNSLVYMIVLPEGQPFFISRGYDLRSVQAILCHRQIHPRS